jgi:hypothetical protein
VITPIVASPPSGSTPAGKDSFHRSCVRQPARGELPDAALHARGGKRQGRGHGLLHARDLQGLADLLPKGRHPAAFLRPELGPGEVDVNVHPAKSAVRLRGGRSAYPLVVGTIRAALAPEKDGGGTASPEGETTELAPSGSSQAGASRHRAPGLPVNSVCDVGLEGV